MKIETARFGEINVNDSQMITFPKGIPSFEEFTRYALLPAEESEENPFYFLQSIQDKNLCFFLLDTLIYFKDYHVGVEDSDISDLRIDDGKDVIVFTLITSKGSLKLATTNLKAPLIINFKRKLGKQIVLTQEQYLIRQPLFESVDDVEESVAVNTSDRQKG